MDDVYILQDYDIDYLNDIFFKDKKELQVVSAKQLFKIPLKHLQLFAHQNAIYSIPTIELADWLKIHFDLSKAIEIGSGNGALAKYLDIPATDSKLQENPEIATLYKLSQQPTVQYGENVFKYEAKDAIRKFKPETVIAQWCTHKYNPAMHDKGGNMYGIDEEFIIKNVKNYVFIGNTFTHANKIILDYPHKSYKMPWLFSRSRYPNLNIIHIWKNKKYEYYQTKGIHQNI